MCSDNGGAGVNVSISAGSSHFSAGMSMSLNAGSSNANNGGYLTLKSGDAGVDGYLQIFQETPPNMEESGSSSDTSSGSLVIKTSDTGTSGVCGAIHMNTGVYSSGNGPEINCVK